MERLSTLQAGASSSWSVEQPRALSMIADFTWLGQAQVSLLLNKEACQHQGAGPLLRSGSTLIGPCSSLGRSSAWLWWMVTITFLSVVL